jgi:hypothetical protein
LECQDKQTPAEVEAAQDHLDQHSNTLAAMVVQEL